MRLYDRAVQRPAQEAAITAQRPFQLATLGDPAGPFPALVVDETAHDLRQLLEDDRVTTWSLLQDWDHSFRLLAELAAGPLGGGTAMEAADVRVPVWPPGQVLCAGANYRRHLIQMRHDAERRQGSTLSDEDLVAQSTRFVEEMSERGVPFYFAGLSGALSSARDDVVLHGPGVEHDWELELAVVIGRPAWRVSREDAMDHVAGYTISNDISTRDVMHRPSFPMTDFLATKVRPTFFPTGPYLVPRQFVADPYDLRITLKVNGEAMQDESTSDMIFGIDRLIQHASNLIQLRPGDLLLTGSPAGNAAHHGGRWLRPGDVMEGSITGLGVQRNRCVAPPD